MSKMVLGLDCGLTITKAVLCALFRMLWDTRSEEDFFDYVRYYVWDHRRLWAEFRT